MPVQTTYDLAAVRAALPALAEVTYLNNGTDGIMAEPVRLSYRAKLDRLDSFGTWGRRELDAEVRGCHERLARLLNATPDEVAVTRNGTDGCSIVLGTFPFGHDAEVLIGSEEHPAILYPALALQTRGTATVRRFRFEIDPAKTLENFERALTPKTRLAAFSHVSCETGIRVPAAEMIRLAHSRGVQVLLDCAQSVGSFRVDFRALGPDFLTGSAHKWLCGPKVTGILAIRGDRVDQMIPAYVGGGSFPEGSIAWRDLSEDLSGVQVNFAAAASRFEYGMQNPALYAGLSAAIDYLEQLGWDNIEAHEREMSTRLKERLSAMDRVRVQTPIPWEHSSAIVNFGIDGVAGRDVSRALWDDHKIVQRAASPDGVRICNGYYTTDEDHDRLIAAIEAIRSRPGP